MTRQTQGLIAINVAAIIFGSAALYGKLPVSPFWIVAMRALFAAITLAVFAILRRELIFKPANAPALILTGLMLALHWLTFFFSVQLSGIAVATLTFASFPLFTLIIESLKNNRVPKPVELAAAVVIIFAVALLVKVDAVDNLFIAGAAAGVASAILFAIFSVLSKKLTSLLPTLSVSLYQNLTVFICLLPALPFTASPSGTVDWVFLVTLGVVTTALMHQLYFYSLQRLSAATCSGFVALEPVYAIVFASILFNEPISATVLVSGILILIASFLILKS